MASQLPAVREAEARPRFLHGGKGAAPLPPPSDGMSMTIVNTSGSASPADLPIQFGMWFKAGDVPDGFIAVPQYQGNDLVYQFDNRAPDWENNALRGGVFRIAWDSSIPAAASRQITFDVRPGSYSNTSAVGLADFMNETDLNVQITNCHDASPVKDINAHVAARISGGVLSGIKVYAPATLTKSTTAVNQAGATAGTFSVSGGVPTVLTPGSGYTMLGGTGAFSVYLNDIIGDIIADGNRINSKRLEWYARGSVCDAFHVTYRVTSHLFVRFYVERYKKADGSFLDYKRYVRFGIGMAVPGLELRNLTYDLDFRDGATVIVGASTDPRYQTMLNFVGSSAMTLDTLGQPYWANNHDAFNAIIPEPTQAECIYLRDTGMIPWWGDVAAPTVTPPVTTGFSEWGSGTPGQTRLLTYQPFGDGGIRAPLGASGGSSQHGILPQLDALRWMARYHGQTANARTWLRQQRVTAAHSMGYPQLGGMPLFEAATMYVANPIPISQQTFTGMTPTRQAFYIHTSIIPWSPTYAYCHPLIGSASGVDSAIRTTSHQIRVAYCYYLQTGDQGALDTIFFQASGPLSARHEEGRVVHLGGTQYHGVYAGVSTNTRNMAWWTGSATQAVAVTPPLWADGSTNPEAELLRYSLTRHFNYMNDLRPFVGTIGLNNAGTLTRTKSFSNQDKGCFAESGLFFSPELDVHFMVDYAMQAFAMAAGVHKGTALGTAAATARDQLGIGMYGMFAGPGPHHGALTGYRKRTMSGPAQSAYIDMAGGWEADPPGLMVNPQGISGENYNFFTMTAGDPLLFLNDGGVKLLTVGGAMGNGSLIMLTPNHVGNTSLGGGTIPGGFNTSTVYYWLQGSGPSNGYLCTALLSPGNPDPDTKVTPTTTVTSSAPTYFWVRFSNMPADNTNWASITAESRLSQHLYTLRIAKAWGMPALGGNRDAAIATLEALVGTRGATHINNLRAAPLYWAASI